jgi:prephenate dehydrogenase
MFGKVVIHGVGLMGGSLGMALQERGLARSVWGIGRHYERLKEACRQGFISDFTLNHRDAAAEADVIVVCLPIRNIPEAVTEFSRYAPEDVLITDVGSTKAEIVTRVEKDLLANPIPFIGSHPMCGSEQTGFEAAIADLYQDATVAITPTPRTPEALIHRCRQLWKAVGGNILILDPDEHDCLAARTSHLPRSVASALCHALEREMDAEKRDMMVSTGFLGASRTALGDIENWARILLSNADHVLDALGDLQGALSNLHHFLSEGNEEGLRLWLAEGAEIRKRLADSIPIARRT